MIIQMLSQHTWVENPEDNIPDYIREQTTIWWLILLIIALGGAIVWRVS